MTNKEKLAIAMAQFQTQIIIRLIDSAAKFLINLGKFELDIPAAFDKAWPEVYDALMEDEANKTGVLLIRGFVVPAHVSNKFAWNGDRYAFVSQKGITVFGKDQITIKEGASFQDIVNVFTRRPSALSRSVLDSFDEFLDIMSKRFVSRDTIAEQLARAKAEEDEANYGKELEKTLSDFSEFVNPTLTGKPVPA